MMKLLDKPENGKGVASLAGLGTLWDERVLIYAKKPFIISRRFTSSAVLTTTFDFSDVYVKKQGIISYLYLHVTNDEMVPVDVRLTIKINTGVIPYTTLFAAGIRTHIDERIGAGERYRIPFELNYPIQADHSRLEIDVVHADDGGSATLPLLTTIVSLTGFVLR